MLTHLAVSTPARLLGSEREPVHRPTLRAVETSQLTDFVRYCERQTGRSFANASAFHSFSVAEFRLFWSLFLRWSTVVTAGSSEPVCTDDPCEQAAFFPSLRLGYVESLLRLDGELHADRPALTSCDGSGHRQRLTRGELAGRVAGLAGGLQTLGVQPLDRVVAITFNDANAVVAGLGAVALGASLSTSSPDMGAFTILARFGQLQPKVLMCHLQDVTEESSALLGQRVLEVIKGLSSLTAIVVLDDGPVPAGLALPVHRMSELERQDPPIAWRRFPFNHPLFVLFSSGTTGQPKCIVHGAGGTLLEHLKEHRLHGDLRPGDKLFFQTSCSWMMWNWQLSALAVGAELVLYSGPVRSPATLWQLVSDEAVTVFGTSPAYLQMCQDEGYCPGAALPLTKLRALMSTGSILYDHQYDWVSANVAPIPVQSISGGTDIIGCFVLGNPNLPVYRGESQCRSLAMDVQAHATGSSGVGELVCRNPFPSRPIGFHADPDGKRFHDAYFKQNEGMWSHGDLIEFTPEQTARLYGRSDGILNVRGIRLGPAEIYRIIQGLPGIKESMVIEQQVVAVPGQSRLVLLLVLAGGFSLDSAFKRRIKLELATRGSAAHVPEIILAVAELPMTHSGKRSERAARDVLNGIQAANAGALKNPGSLEKLTRQLEEEELRRAEAQPVVRDASLEVLLAGIWERVLDLAPVEPTDNFFELGGTSLLALRMFNEVKKQTGRELPASMLFDAPTVALLAAAIREDRGGAFSPVVRLKGTGEGQPVFFVHGLAGEILELRSVAAHLPRTVPGFGFRARGLDPQQQPHITVEQMAACYVEHLRRAQPTGPYAIVGYSFGGLVAFEMGRLLSEAGEQVKLIGLLDTQLPDACLAPLERASYRVLRKVHRGTSWLCRKAPKLLALLRPLRSAIERQLGASSADPRAPAWKPHELTLLLVQLEAIGWTAFHAYRPGLSACPVTFFKADIRSTDFCDPIPLWGEATGGKLKVVDVPGDHFTMIREPWAAVLAGLLSERL